MFFLAGGRAADSSLGGVAGVSLPAQVAMGVGLYSLALVTCVGNAMVIHAIRTEKRLRKVGDLLAFSLCSVFLLLQLFEELNGCTVHR